tara:strand:+ start:520 stop:1266 length:747 start_codon:yes stop_codon:yes gene_type:complete
MILKNEFEKLLKNKKYFLPVRRTKKTSFDNYYRNVVDPDGKVRDLKNEKFKKIKDFKIILDYLKKSKNGGDILDIGCGYGWMLSQLNKKKFKTYGVEINSDCRIIAERNMHYYANDLKEFKNKKFDYISLIHVIEHLKNPVNFIDKIKKRLKKGGTFIIETPDFDSAMGRMYNFKFRLLHDSTHISLFSLDSLKRLLRDKGFHITKIEFPYFEGPHFNKRNINKLFKKKIHFSPPFYGSIMTIFCYKK